MSEKIINNKTKYIHSNITSKNGILYFANQNVVDLAKKYMTPLYLMDEDRVREKCRIFVKTFKENFGENGLPLYASKANCFKYLYKILKEENMGIDVVSSGEIWTAASQGFNMENAFFHSNNKTDTDIEYAMENKIGYFVVDNIEELDVINKIASKKNIVQKILLRITPGIDPHTYEADVTGKVDSKFGQAIETGQAEEIMLYAMKCKNLSLKGFHCHVGSQIFYEDVFERTAEVMINFISDMKGKHNFITEVLDLGGGFGVRYVETDPYLNIEEKIKDVADVIKSLCSNLNLKMPYIYMEPGRSIVGDAGMTLYTVGTVKKIPLYKNYVSVDGGMTDNPRHALYGADYTCYIANKMDETVDMKVSVVGRCCESGDIISENVLVPSSTKRYDILAVATTGAYHYSMASNYNRIEKPAVVILKNGNENFIAVKRETYEDMGRNEV